VDKIEVKKLFWKIVNVIEGCSDTIIKNGSGVITERGMTIENDYSIMFGLDDGVIRIYDNEHFPIAAFTEENEVLLILKDLFEELE